MKSILLFAKPRPQPGFCVFQHPHTRRETIGSNYMGDGSDLHRLGEGYGHAFISPAQVPEAYRFLPFAVTG